VSLGRSYNDVEVPSANVVFKLRGLKAILNCLVSTAFLVVRTTHWLDDVLISGCLCSYP
jgi:hypothetical protein